MPKDALSQVQSAGFNLVTGPAEKNYLDAAQRANLRVLASPGTSAGKTFQADRARQTVARLDSHPALWAWYLIDEPDLNNVSPGDVSKANRFLKNSGAHKPTALVLYQGGEALNFGNIADITMVDRYPIPWLPLANFPQHVRMARLALGPQKPLVAVIQAFDWESCKGLLPGGKDLRPPTYSELRCMSYSALARQATGLFYYCFDNGSWKIAAHPQVWSDLKKVIAEIKENMPLFCAEHVWWPYVHEYSDLRSGFNEALESSIIPALLRVDHGSKMIPSGLYLLTANTTERILTYRITLPKAKLNGSIPVVQESRVVAIQDDWLQDKFGPFDVHIYGPIR